MKKIFLLSSCDAWHSHNSMRAIGVFSTLKLLVGYLKRYDKLTKQDMIQIISIGQTQGREVNYCIETLKVNPKFEV
jgi:hypothetical protein